VLAPAWEKRPDGAAREGWGALEDSPLGQPDDSTQRVNSTYTPTNNSGTVTSSSSYSH
jgi:hypothetical protein